ncbi:MAG: hypothetical protein EHM28_03915, partial [Spirochaetaceae bacterium]
MRQIFILLCMIIAGSPAAWAHPNDVATVSLAHYQTETAHKHYLNGKVFINGYVIAQLAQQYNLDPAQLVEYQLRNTVWPYFDYHLGIEGKN